jgi:hypothetical protein
LLVLLTVIVLRKGYHLRMKVRTRVGFERVLFKIDLALVTAQEARKTAVRHSPASACAADSRPTHAA